MLFPCNNICYLKYMWNPGKKHEGTESKQHEGGPTCDFSVCLKDCLVATGLVQKLFVMSVTNIFMVVMGLTDTLCMIKKQLFMVLVGMIKIMVSVGMDRHKKSI
jgi:hypothetical protein